MFGPTKDTKKSRATFRAKRYCTIQCANKGGKGNGRVITPLADRFRTGVDVRGEDDCWEWQKATSVGYGMINDGTGRIIGAHRVAYRLAFGDFDPGLDVLHKCDNPPCCNPKHLFLGTARDNVLDMMAKGRGRNGAAGAAK